MLTIVTTKKFEKSLQRMRKRGKSLVKIKSVIEQLATKGILESRDKKHQLVGNWQGFYECHIEPRFTKLMAMSCCWQRRGRIRIYFFEMNWIHYGLTTNDGKMQIMEEGRGVFADSR